MQVWKWTQTKRDVLQDVFLAEMSHAKIMQKHGVSRGTFESWMKHPDFAAELKAQQDDLVRSLAVQGVRYVTKQDRIRSLSQKAESASAEYDARPLLREIRPLPQKAPIRIRTKRDEASRDEASRDEASDGAPADELTEPVDAIVNESFNADAFAAFRGALDDIAKELGARKNVTELSGSVDVNERVLFVLPERYDDLHDPLPLTDATDS